MDDLSNFHYRCFTDDDVDVAYKKIKSISLKPVKKMESILLCVVATEISKKGKSHIHAQISTNLTMQALRARLRLIYPSSGNKSYSLEKQKTENLTSYVIKGGTYRYCPEMAEIVRTAPPWVEPSTSFEKSYALLEDDYLNGDMTDYEFIYKLIGIYADHKKHIYISHIRALWLGVANRRNKALNYTYRYRVEGNGRPFRHRLVEEIMRGFFIYDN